MPNQQVIDAIAALPEADKVEVLADGLRKLPTKERKKAATQGLAGPTRQASDVIWLVIVVGVVAAMLASVASFYSGNGDAEKMLAVFTATIGFIAGLISPSPMSKADNA